MSKLEEDSADALISNTQVHLVNLYVDIDVADEPQRGEERHCAEHHGECIAGEHCVSKEFGHLQCAGHVGPFDVVEDSIQQHEHARRPTHHQHKTLSSIYARLLSCCSTGSYGLHCCCLLVNKAVNIDCRLIWAWRSITPTSVPSRGDPDPPPDTRFFRPTQVHIQTAT